MTAPKMCPYENSLSIDQLRRELRWEWDQKHAFIQALLDLPEIPPVIVLDFLSRAGKWPEDWEQGKRLQRQYGLELVPPKTEYEKGAGLWYRIRAALTVPQSEERDHSPQKKP